MPRRIRQIRIEGNLAYVPLTRGYEAIIDAADVHLVNRFNWFASVRKNTVYAFRNDRGGIKPRLCSMHRTIMGEPDELHVDHIDGNGLNNSRNNLREATISQNNCNRAMQSNNISGFKGVHWHKLCQKWRAQIKVKGKITHLGVFDCPEDAHKAYCEASEKMHGEFGRVQ